MSCLVSVDWNFLLSRKGSNGNEKLSDEQKEILQNIDKLRANIDGLEEKSAHQGKLTDEDKEKGFKILNMKELKNFEQPNMEIKKDNLGRSEL